MVNGQMDIFGMGLLENMILLKEIFTMMTDMNITEEENKFIILMQLEPGPIQHILLKV